MSRLPALVILTALGSCFLAFAENDIVLHDDFSTYSSGIWMGVIGAEAEYHYFPQTAPVGNWCVSTYRSEPESQRAWRIEEWEGRRVLAMEYTNKWEETHPMVVAGDVRWRDYTVEVAWSPLSDKGRSGVIFRYQTDRCYYMLGVASGKVVLMYVKDGDSFRKPHEEILAEQTLDWKAGDWLSARIEVTGNRIHASVGGKELEANHEAFAQGRIALTADGPARFREVTVRMTPDAKAEFDKRVQDEENALNELRAQNPKPVLWKKFRIDGYGVGRNLRFGDLDGDGQKDVLVCQPVHHGPKDAGSEVSCLTAVTFDGKKIWQVGDPDPWKKHLTSDVAFQIHDIDGNGRNEVIYCKGMELIIADGATGNTLAKVPTPETPANTKKPFDRYPRILGDSLFFCDLRGQGREGDIVLKDRYQSFWVYDESLKLQWQAQCNTGHYPYAADIDQDGKEELAIGYSLY
ncbi:MAG: family 16 glycoside hydrolase, partial [Candidatus Hydrogenedentales bacterium]